ncbi:hypothetical protein DPEC_G00250250 [Dallia pectoralis]|uniref:Uncharacterized protein n=1 Tax=Dallia pectoralis TaxID=75939 RepID=A0ACC2FT94_DALPE|nr:hypothetical protein DPEC_G00250250 [Dallia pectoralis]
MEINMESIPDPSAGDPGNSASEPATAVMDTPANLEVLGTDDHHHQTLSGGLMAVTVARDTVPFGCCRCTEAAVIMFTAVTKEDT